MECADLCEAYNWPTGLAGGGVIAIVELGGGWVQSDMQQFFTGIGQPVPNITVSTDSEAPAGADRNADGDVALERRPALPISATGKPVDVSFAFTGHIASAVRAADS